MSCKDCDKMKEAMLRLIKAVEDSASARNAMTNLEARALAQCARAMGWPTDAPKILKANARR